MFFYSFSIFFNWWYNILSRNWFSVKLLKTVLIPILGKNKLIYSSFKLVFNKVVLFRKNLPALIFVYELVVVVMLHRSMPSDNLSQRPWCHIIKNVSFFFFYQMFTEHTFLPDRFIITVYNLILSWLKERKLIWATFTNRLLENN